MTLEEIEDILEITITNEIIKNEIILRKSGDEVGNYLTLNEGFDHEFDGSRYAQYPGKYYVYFFPTRTNEPEELIESILNIDKDNGFFSTLEIPVTDGDSKIFNGHLILSKKTYTAFLNL